MLKMYQSSECNAPCGMQAWQMSERCYCCSQERFPPYFPAVRDAQARKPLSTVPNTKLAWERSAECHGSQIERPKSCTSRDSDSPVLHVSAHRPSSTSQLHHKFEFEPIAPAAGGVESVGVGFSAVMQTKPRPPHAMPPRQRTLRPCAPPGSSPCVLEDVSSPPRFRPSPPPPPHLSPSPPPPLLAAAAASVPWADEHDDDDDDAVFGSIVLGCGHEECVASLRRRALTPSTTALTCDSCSHPVNDSLIRVSDCYMNHARVYTSVVLL